MINIIEARISITKNLITFYESNKENQNSEYDKVWEKGYLFALKQELKTLEELLTSAKELKRLSA